MRVTAIFKSPGDPWEKKGLRMENKANKKKAAWQAWWQTYPLF